MIVDRVAGISATQNQNNAMSEDIKAMKKVDEASLAVATADREKATVTARSLETQIEEAKRRGDDIEILEKRLRDVEATMN